VSRRLVVRRNAKTDIRDARRWYEARRAGLGREFLDEVDATLARIRAMPMRFIEVMPGVRQALTERFPYAVYFRVEDKRIFVFVVIHTSRDSEVWQQRMDEELGER
jgi:plasmid stabilization system protein ParE